MPIAITLIAAAADKKFSAFASDCRARLTGQGYTTSMPDALHSEQAYDLIVESEDADKLRLTVESFLAGHEVDAIVQPAEGRRKKFLLADMESTIIQQEMLEEMADAIGARAHVTEVTRRAMNGEIDFLDALRERVVLFAGQPEKLLNEMAARITPMPGAAALVATMRAQGATCWLASGGFRFFTQPVAARLGFHQDFANDLLIENHKLTGKVAEPILDKHGKQAIFERGLAELKIDAALSLTVGDGANDLAMLDACTKGGGIGIAFHAKPVVQEQAKHKINHANLTALLYAQGYRSDDFKYQWSDYAAAPWPLQDQK